MTRSARVESAARQHSQSENQERITPLIPPGGMDTGDAETEWSPLESAPRRSVVELVSCGGR